MDRTKLRRGVTRLIWTHMTSMTVFVAFFQNEWELRTKLQVELEQRQEDTLRLFRCQLRLGNRQETERDSIEQEQALDFHTLMAVCQNMAAQLANNRLLACRGCVPLQGGVRGLAGRICGPRKLPWKSGSSLEHSDVNAVFTPLYVLQGVDPPVGEPTQPLTYPLTPNKSKASTEQNTNSTVRTAWRPGGQAKREAPPAKKKPTRAEMIAKRKDDDRVLRAEVKAGKEKELRRMQDAVRRTRRAELKAIVARDLKKRPSDVQSNIGARYLS
eukprot:NODE_3481_length_887_cov_45.957895_g3459_i0.p1 GENE.NODE_3481_length_887_cov_45.957895_g3459_i0~~NODE_3481_length_887_cov_45.957895_g3459_i0.p1  ORF type:complete len:283 (-),score=44.61 NODE_3481_length_887_cov_45.957895_g3459_i0:37-849(-)